MFEIIQALILGAVQGLGEFLPISSSGHLVFIHYLFLDNSLVGNKSQELALDVSLHLGTLISVGLFFKEEILRELKISKEKIKQGIFKESKEFQLFKIIIIATLPGALLGVVGGDFIEEFLRSPLLVAIALIGGGLLLFLADLFGQKSEKKNKKEGASIRNISWAKALLIGGFQALALVPGVSRSGATITAGLFSGLKRKAAAKFSFILSMPIIAGAALIKVPSLLKTEIDLMLVLVGTGTAFIVGFLSIKYMLRYLTCHGYLVFMIYRILLASVIIFLVFKK